MPSKFSDFEINVSEACKSYRIKQIFTTYRIFVNCFYLWFEGDQIVSKQPGYDKLISASFVF